MPAAPPGGARDDPPALAAAAAAAAAAPLAALGPPSSAYLSRIVLVSTLGGLLFGLDTGIASGMLVSLRSDLGHVLSAREQGVFVCATTVGAIAGALGAGRLADWRGRRSAMIVSSVFFALGSIEQAASQVLRELVLGRVLVGLGVGMSSMVVPTFLAECAPADVRGRMVGANSLLVTGGQALAYTVAALLYALPHSWRWMVLLGALPALAQLGGLWTLDESPRWLSAHGRHEQARAGVAKLYPTASREAVDAYLRRFERGHEERAAVDKRGALRELFQSSHGRRALALACGLQAAQQLCGANSILYFSSRLLLMAGFSANPNVPALGVAVGNFLGTCLALRLVDRLGRRRLLLGATAAASVALSMLAVSLGQIHMKDVVDRPGDAPGSEPAGAWAYVSLAMMIAFIFSYALGLGIIPWLVQSEIFPGRLRGVGGGLATATNWTCNLLVAATYLDLVRLITPQGTFWGYAAIAALSWAFTYAYLPEMAGVDLSDATRLFDAEQAHDRGTAQGEYEPLRPDGDGDEWDSNDDEPRARPAAAEP